MMTWPTSGWSWTTPGPRALLRVAREVIKAHDADEQVDANRDGVRDVEAMGSQELVQHKAEVVMRSTVA